MERSHDLQYAYIINLLSTFRIYSLTLWNLHNTYVNQQEQAVEVFHK